MSEAVRHFSEFIQKDGKEFYVEGKAWGTYSCSNGRLYMSNGDPGYPDEEELEIDEVEITHIDCSIGEEEVEVLPEDEKEIEEYLFDYLGEDLYDWEID